MSNPTLPPSIWFSLYAFGLAVMTGLYIVDVPGWVQFAWGALFMLFAIITDPAPRKARESHFDPRLPCDCRSCARAARDV